MDIKKFYIETKGNYDNALSLMMNDVVIVKLLTKFINNDLCEQIISSYERKDYRQIFAASHSLKGVAGNLALTPLFDIASIITESTRNSNDVNLDKEINELKNIYELIKDNYSKYVA